MVRMAADQVHLFLREMMVDTKNVLQRELDKVQARIAALEAAVEAKPDYGLGKGDPAVTRWELDRVLLQDLREQAQRLAQALSRTGEGTYGICEHCGNPIHPDRMAVLPDARLCIRCARSPRDGQLA
jgi:RNA polymerase-binding transcription factor DksA